MDTWYENPRPRGPKLLVILAIAGWVIALAVGAAFAWFAFWGPGSSREPPEQAPSPTATSTVTLTPTATPTPTTTPTPSPTPTPTPPDSPLPTPTPEPTLTPTPSATLVAGEDGANVRAGPGTEFEKLGELEPGETVLIIGLYEDWYLVEFQGAPAWIASWVVEATNLEYVPGVDDTGAVVATPSGPAPTPAATSAVTLTVGENGANVRSGPGTEFDLLGALDPGDTAEVTGRYEDWYRIDYEGASGWVAGWIVEVTGAENVPEVDLIEASEPALDEEGTPTATVVRPTPEPSFRTEEYVVDGAPGPFSVGDDITFSFRVVNLTDADMEFRAIGTRAQETDELFGSLESVAPDPPLEIGPGQALEGTGTIRFSEPGSYTLWLYMVLADDTSLQLAGPVAVTIG